MKKRLLAQTRVVQPGLNLLGPNRLPEGFLLSAGQIGGRTPGPWAHGFKPLPAQLQFTVVPSSCRRPVSGAPMVLGGMPCHGSLGSSLRTGHPARTRIHDAPNRLPASVDWINLTFVLLLAAATAFQAACFAFGVW